jgi:hypothetical protein
MSSKQHSKLDKAKKEADLIINQFLKEQQAASSLRSNKQHIKMITSP